MVWWFPHLWWRKGPFVLLIPNNENISYHMQQSCSWGKGTLSTLASYPMRIKMTPQAAQPLTPASVRSLDIMSLYTRQGPREKYPNSSLIMPEAPIMTSQTRSRRLLDNCSQYSPQLSMENSTPREIWEEAYQNTKSCLRPHQYS